MKLTAQASTLAAAAKAAAGAIDERTAKRSPILAALLIDAVDYSLRFVGTDLDMAIAAKCSGDGIVEEPGCCAVAGEALSKLLAGIAPTTEVAVETIDSGLQIKAGRARYKLPALPVEDFPVAPATTSSVEIVLSHDEVQHLFGSVAFAMNTETARTYLRGVYLHYDSCGHLAGVATDGHRLALASSTITPAPRALPANGKGTGFIVPLKTVNSINKLKAAEIELRVDSKVLEIRAGDLTIASKLIDGMFPDYLKIVPAKSNNIAEVEREVLLAALKRLNAARNAAGQDVNMTLTWKNGSNARLAVADGEIAEDIVAAETTGAAQITLAIAQMLVMASEIEAKQLQLSVAGKSDPMRITAGDLLAVLAPCTR